MVKTRVPATKALRSSLSSQSRAGFSQPTTSQVTAVAGCEKPARLWLDKDERKAFVAGTRVFTIGGGVKVRVADDLFPN